MESYSQIVVGLGSFLLVSVVLSNVFKPNLKAIPTVGGSGIYASYVTAFRFITRGREVIEQGCAQYPSTLFKIPMVNTWQIIVTNPEHIGEIRRAKDEDLSLVEAQNDTLGLEFTVGWERGTQSDYHVKVLQRMLTTNYASNCPDLYDEVVRSLESVISLQGNEWTQVTAYPSALKVIARVSNRLYVGLPLCQDPDYIQLVLDHSQGVPPAGMFINLFPKWLQQYIGPVISPLERNKRRSHKVFGAYLAERIRLFREHGKEWEDKPNDMITWLLEEAEEHQREASNIAMRLLRINFAGLMSTSLTLSHALHHLAASQEYIPILREEAEAIVSSEGWTKAAVSKMFKIDSFLRETTRLSGFSALTLHRKVMNPSGFTFSDGTTLPQGCYVAASAYTVHREATNFDNPEVFDGLRFYKMRDPAEEDVVKHQLTTPATSNLVFGIGKHVCPGRFFMTHNLKTILAHIVLTYDIKFEEEGVRPADYWVGGNRLPNSKAKVMFRKRQA